MGNQTLKSTNPNFECVDINEQNEVVYEEGIIDEANLSFSTDLLKKISYIELSIACKNLREDTKTRNLDTYALIYIEKKYGFHIVKSGTSLVRPR
jgi:hypothetical protein